MQEILSLKVEKVRTQTYTAGESGSYRNITQHLFLGFRYALLPAKLMMVFLYSLLKFGCLNK